MMPTFPCRCEITSNQYYSQGWCYGIGINNGVPFALIVRENGAVIMQQLDGVYSVTLI